MRLRFTESALVLVLLGGCATAAPPLPVDATGMNRGVTLQAQDFSPADVALDCGQIDAEYAANLAAQTQDTQAIEGNRTRNQAAAFVSLAGPAVLAPFALAATDSNAAERQQDARLTLRNDTLRQLAGVKGCR